MAQVIKIPYKPRPLQKEFHTIAPRFTVLVAHRRYGKTVLAINELLKRGLQCKWPRPQCSYVAPTYSQAQRIAWGYLKLYAGVIPGSKFNEASLRAEIPLGDERGNLTIYLVGAENADSLRGMYNDFIVADEFGLFRPSVWSEILRPTISDRLGGALWLGTPKGHNAFYDRYMLAKRMMEGGDPDWLAICHTADDTGIIDKDELKAVREEMSPEEFAQEYLCSFTAAIKGAYFAEDLELSQSSGRIGDFKYDPHYPVDTSWDLGFRDATAIWSSQTIDGVEHFIDFYEATGEGLDHYIKYLSLKPWTFNNHYLPHDVMVHELGSGTSRYEILREKGIRATVAPKLKIEDGIEACRLELKTVKFDAVGCAAGIEHLRHYRKQWDDKLQVFRTKPLHDHHSNAADAFRIFATSRRDTKTRFGYTPAVIKNGRLPDGRMAVLTDYADEFA